MNHKISAEFDGTIWITMGPDKTLSFWNSKPSREKFVDGVRLFKAPWDVEIQGLVNWQEAGHPTNGAWLFQEVTNW